MVKINLDGNNPTEFKMVSELSVHNRIAESDFSGGGVGYN